MALRALARRIVGALGAAYIRLVYHTTRWERIGQGHLDAAFAAPSFVAAVWHARLLPIAMLRPRRRRAVALASANRDGDLIAKIVEATGAETVRGSSRDPRKPHKDKGGADAAPKLVRALNEGAIVVITPDGPRGPRMRAKPGVAALSAAAGAPVLPVAYSVKRAWLFETWDRFMLPWPFNRGVMVFGAPIAPPDAGDPSAIEARRAEIEAALNAATREADARLGRETPTPAGAEAAR